MKLESSLIHVLYGTAQLETYTSYFGNGWFWNAQDLGEGGEEVSRSISVHRSSDSRSAAAAGPQLTQHIPWSA
jgi:hypothetical protein